MTAVVKLSPFAKREKCIISMASLYDHVDGLHERVQRVEDSVDSMNDKLDAVLEILRDDRKSKVGSGANGG